MKRPSSAFLLDIKLACASVNSFVQGFDLNRYLADELVRAGVERKLLNIGEALSQLARQDPELALRVPRYQRLIGFRNVLVHGYSGLNDIEIWRALHDNMPGLQTAVEALLQELAQPPSP